MSLPWLVIVEVLSAVKRKQLEEGYHLTISRGLLVQLKSCVMKSQLDVFAALGTKGSDVCIDSHKYHVYP